MIDFSNPDNRVYRPDILKRNLHCVQIVLIDSGALLTGGKTGDYDNRSIKELGNNKVLAYSLESKINLSTSISLNDVINDKLGSQGDLGTFAFNNLDTGDALIKKNTGKYISEHLGLSFKGKSIGQLPPLVPKLSYERKTAYGGATLMNTNVNLIFQYESDFVTDVVDKVETLAKWYLPQRGDIDIGDLIGSSLAILEPVQGESKIITGLKAIAKEVQDVTADIFKGCFFLTVPVGARNPTRIYYGPEKSNMKPTYAGDWLVNSFGLSTTDFVVYDKKYDCLRPELVNVSLGLTSWRVTDNKSFNVFNK